MQKILIWQLILYLPSTSMFGDLLLSDDMMLHYYSVTETVVANLTANDTFFMVSMSNKLCITACAVAYIYCSVVFKFFYRIPYQL